MADTAPVGTGETDGRSASAPRALIHKKILEVAASDPNATMAEIADDVSGASTDLVERVLDEYGDPATSAGDTAAAEDDDAGSHDAGSHDAGSHDAGSVDAPGAGGESEAVPGTDDGDEAPIRDGESIDQGQETGESQTETAGMTDERNASVPTPEALNDKERAVLEAVAERPAATQQELADALGVSRATISKRANGIDGFDWQQRVAFVDRLFDDQSPALTADGRGEPTGVGPGHASNGHGSRHDDAPPEPAGERGEAPPGPDGERGEAPPGPDGERGEAPPGPAGERVDALEDRLVAVEERLDAAVEERLDAATEKPPDAAEPAVHTDGCFDDPALAHKVVHACMNAETVSEDEELRVIAAVLSGTESG